MATHTDDNTQLKRALEALQQMRARLEAVERARHEPVAVVGMACRFPGGATDPERLWRLMVEGRDAIVEVPPERWPVDAHYSPEAKAVGKMSTRWGGFVDGVDRFDPGFFGISPREAAQMDPQQRLLLEVGWEAFENAGIPRERLGGSATGVFVGVHSHSSDYMLFQFRDPERIGTYTATGTAHSILANRLSYWLDLRGPSLAVDTACSSSLVAAHLAVQSLRTRECDLALAGGVNLMLGPEMTVATTKMRMMAADGRCKAFDARADGFVRGEGCGLLVLKRLSDAVAAHDPVLAIVAGSAVNQDGATNGLTAPSGLAQREVVRRALADGKVDAARVTYVETHGTGTALGDPIEVESLAEVLGRAGAEPCVLGSVKTNIGHLEAAAGVAGLIKAVLSLQRGEIPPNLHFERLNPHIRLEGTRFVLPAEPRPWPAGGDRHAGVSSFGFGGTNAHVVLREAPAAPSAPLEVAGREPGTAAEGGPTNRSTAAEAPASRRSWVLPVSARTPDALLRLAGAYRELLAASPPPLADLCFTASVRRTHFEHRLAVVGDSPAQLAAALQAMLEGVPSPDAVRGQADPDSRRRLAFAFSGQGSQWPEMGRSLLADEPVFRTAVDECDVHFRRLSGWSLVDELSAAPQRSRLHRTEVAQPALFALQVGLAALWRSWGLRPDAVVGHSAGEVAAAHVAGVLDLEQAVRVVYHRGRLMQAAEGSGRMAALGLSRVATEAVLDGSAGRVVIAAVNGPSSTVVSGERGAVERLVARLTEEGVFARLLPVPLAAHGPAMEPLRAALVEALAGLAPRAASLPLYSSVTGREAAPGDFDARYWGRNLREPVVFADAIDALCRSGATDVLEIGPHPVLGSALRQCIGAPDVLIAGSLERTLPERHTLLRALASLHTAGHAVDWSALHPAGGCVVRLPNYPWQRERYWLDRRERGRRPPHPDATACHARDAAAITGRLLSSPALTGFVYESRIARSTLAYLGEHRLAGEDVLPAAIYVELLRAAGRAVLGREALGIDGLAIHLPLALPETGECTVQCILEPAEPGVLTAEVHSRTAHGAAPWTLHATARIAAESVPASPPLGTGDGDSPAGSDAGLSDKLAALGSTPASSENGGSPPLVSINRTWHGESELLAGLQVRAGEPEDQLSAALLGTGFRLLARCGAARAHPDAAPVVASLQRLRFLQPAASASFCHARLRSPDGSDGNGTHRARGDVLLLDAAGSVVAEAYGVEFAPVPHPEAPDADPASWVHEVVWRPSGLLAHARRPAGNVLPTPDRLAKHLTGPSSAPHADQPSAESLAVELDRLCAAYVVQALRQLGARFVPGERVDASLLARRSGTGEPRRRIFERLCTMLAEAGILRHDAAGYWEVSHPPEPIDPDAALDQLAARHPHWQTELGLLRRCGPRIAGVLRGECDPLALLFTGDSLADVERLYRDAPTSRRANRLVAQAVERIVHQVPETRALRILEIGAGTGGTTAHVLPLVEGRPAEYVFTDVSPSLLERARAASGDRAYVRFELLDIERDPEAQGYAPHQFDVVLAANVLHATTDLRAAVARVRRLLSPGGLLLLLEGVRPACWIDLVFGLTDGWWKFTDSELRPSHPLLAAEAWCRLLEAEGFSDPRAIPAGSPADGALFEQALIVAGADVSRAAAGTPGRAARAAANGVAGPESRAASAGRWLVVGDAGGIADALASELRELGGECVVAAPGAPDALAEHASLADGVVYLRGADLDPIDRTAAADPETVALVCDEAAALARALAELPRPPRLWIVTRGAQPVDAGDAPNPAAAALWGLGRSVALEYPAVWGGLVDLAPGEDAAAGAEQLRAPLLDGDSEDQVGFRGGDRFVPRLVNRRETQAAGPSFRGDGAYLISGGLGEVGLRLAHWLAERGAGEIVLVGRRGLPARASWPTLAAGSPASVRAAQVAAIERLGARVTVAADDVADAGAMARLFSRFGADLPPLRGVFHAAAVMNFLPMPKLNREALDEVLRPKVAGGWMLHRLTRELPLDHFVLFSSVAGLWGARGMAHYGAANQFLDALAHLRRAEGLPALVIDWGGWAGGDTSSDTVRFLQQSAFRLMPAEPALRLLGSAMASGATHRVIAQADWAALRASFELHSRRPFLSEIGVEPTEPSRQRDSQLAADAGALAAQLRDLEDAEAQEVLTSHVRTEVAGVLGLGVEQLMEPGQGFFRLGMDSLMSVELRARLERSLGLPLPTTVAFEYPTVESLAGFLRREVRLRTAAGAPAVSGSGGSAPPAALGALSPHGLDQLSEDELASMLDGAVAHLLDDEAGGG